MTPGELTFKNAKVVTPTGIVEGTVHVRQGVIEEIDGSASSLPATIDCEGDYLIPGLVDLHTDNLEKHTMPRANAAWPLTAALVAHDSQMAAAGITTVFDSLCVFGLDEYDNIQVRSLQNTRDLIAEIEAGAESGIFRAEHLLHLRVELPNPETPRHFDSVRQSSALRLVSLMDHTAGQRQWVSPELFAKMMMKEMRITEEKALGLIAEQRERQQKYAEPNRRELLAMMSETNIVLATHDDATVEHVEQAHADGIAISEFPTTQLAAESARQKGMKVIGGSPNLVLGRSHSGNVSVSELAARGLLDALASDYVPSSLLHGAFLLHETVGIPLHEAIQTITLAPARMTGLDDRGSIEAGQRADLVRVRLARGIPLAAMVWREGIRVA